VPVPAEAFPALHAPQFSHAIVIEFHGPHRAGRASLGAARLFHPGREGGRQAPFLRDLSFVVPPDRAIGADLTRSSRRALSPGRSARCRLRVYALHPCRRSRKVRYRMVACGDEIGDIHHGRSPRTRRAIRIHSWPCRGCGSPYPGKLLSTCSSLVASTQLLQFSHLATSMSEIPSLHSFAPEHGHRVTALKCRFSRIGTLYRITDAAPGPELNFDQAGARTHARSVLRLRTFGVSG